MNRIKKMKHISQNRRGFLLRLGKAVSIASTSGFATHAFAKSVEKNATIASIALKKQTDGQLRLVFKLDKKIKYKLLTLSQPDRVVIDFLNTAIVDKPLTLGQNEVSDIRLIKRIRQSVRNESDYRIVLDLSKKAKASTKFKSSTSGNFLEVTLQSELLDKRKKSDKALRIAKTNKKTISAVNRNKRGKPLIIAIDAGHGGRDPGAVGKKGTKEKKIALQIAKRLQKRINRQAGMKAVLIRDGDYYVRLDKRIAKARAKRADVFVSIHADANPNRKLTGSSVYILSESGASSAAAKWLAQNENSYEAKMADTHLKYKNKVVSSVLLDMSLSETIDQSLDLASNVLKELGGVNRLLRRRVESAGFAVLKSPDIPSMLVETAFLSNPMEEKRLKSSAYQEKIAKAIFKGVRKYQIALNKSGSRYT